MKVTYREAKVIRLYTLLNSMSNKDGSRAGLNPKPTGFKPDGGGGGSNFSPAGLRVRGPDTVRGGGGSAISPAGDPRAPEV
jgi:hypothetical protein